MADETPFEKQVRNWSNFDLLDVARHIDKDAFPDRYRILQEEIAGRKGRPLPGPDPPPARPAPSRYATFWRRAGACLLDGLILMPVAAGAPFLAGATSDPLLAATPEFVASLLFYLYPITFHARSGQTIGKRAAGVRVLDRSGGKLGAARAITRDLVPLSLSIAALVLVVNIELPAAVSGLGDRLPLLLFSSIAALWWLAEILTMATNRRRLAVQDLIAGSVVVRLDAGAPPSPEEEAR